VLARRRQALETLTISALDLFASSLGVFVLMAILLFPFYLREPSVEAELLGARAELSAAGRSLTEAEREAADTERRSAEAAAAVAEAQERLARAEADAADAAEELSDAEAAARVTPAPEPVRGSTGRREGKLSINDLDLVFVMDTTGSMRGELRDLQASLLGVIRILARLAPTLQVGFVAYRDRGETYVTRAFLLSPMDEANARDLVAFVGKLDAEAGGDDPEAVDEALRVAVDMPWRADAQGRIVVIGDAPARTPDWQRTFDMAAGFRRSSPGPAAPRGVSAIFAGDDPGAEAFFERLAEAGGGEFTPHQGQMIESVLLSVLRKDDGGGAGAAR
jgi:multidrug efflux pump subunit AcrA (membrane-fusion protein)